MRFNQALIANDHRRLAHFRQPHPDRIVGHPLAAQDEISAVAKIIRAVDILERHRLRRRDRVVLDRLAARVAQQPFQNQKQPFTARIDHARVGQRLEQRGRAIDRLARRLGCRRQHGQRRGIG